VPAAGAPLSPELVLVDPELARALADGLGALVTLPARTTTEAQPGDRVGLHPWNVRASSAADQTLSGALHRITEFSELDPPRRRLPRLRRFLALTAAWGAMVLVVGGLELGVLRLPL
jgi:hypothetical protein